MVYEALKVVININGVTAFSVFYNFYNLKEN